MSQITQLNHFAGNIYLPNTTNQSSVEGAKATSFILKYEPEYLLSVDARPISLAMPLKKTEYFSKTIFDLKMLKLKI